MKTSEKLKAKGFVLTNGKNEHGDNAIAFLDGFTLSEEQEIKLENWMEENNVVGSMYIMNAYKVLSEARKQKNSTKPKKPLKDFAEVSPIKYSPRAVKALELIGEGDEDDFQLIETAVKSRLVFSESHIFSALLDTI